MRIVTRICDNEGTGLVYRLLHPVSGHETTIWYFIGRVRFQHAGCQTRHYCRGRGDSWHQNWMCAVGVSLFDVEQQCLTERIDTILGTDSSLSLCAAFTVVEAPQ